MRYMFFFWVAIGLTACEVTTLPSNPSIKEINSLSEARSVIQKGMTMDQVKAKLGQPNHRYTLNSRTVWSYTQADIKLNPVAVLAGTGLPDTKAVTVTFDTRGRVIEIGFTAMQNR